MRSFCLALLALGIGAANAQDVYEIDAGASNVHWRVYKAGAFARFGHNHVISVGEMQGQVVVESELAASRFEIVIEVATLIVDDPQLRAGYGEEFASEPSEEDIAGTKGNMLSETVLNGEQFPELTINGTGLTALGEPASLDIAVEMLGRSVTLEVPATVEIDAERLTATGEFSLTHADLGMEPFSVMMGALQVGEQLDFSYRVHATKAR